MLRKVIKKVLIFAVSWGACTTVVLAPGAVITTLGFPATTVLGLTLYSGLLPYTLDKII